MPLYIEIDQRYVISQYHAGFILYENKRFPDTSKKIGSHYLKLLAYYSSFATLIEGLLCHHLSTLKNNLIKHRRHEIQRMGRLCHEAFKYSLLSDADTDEIKQGIKYSLLRPDRLIYIECHRLLN